MKTLLILTLLLSLTLAQSASAYTVEANHPRLYVTEITDNTLVAKCKSAMSTNYTAHKSWVDTHLIDDSYPLGFSEGYPLYMKDIALCHLVEGPADTTYYHEMKDMLAYCFAQANWEQSRYYLEALAIFYDWANPELVTGGLDDNYGDSLGVALTWHTANFAGGNWSGMNNAHSKLSRMRELASAGIALAGDGHNDAAATAACDTFYNNSFGGAHAIAMIDSIARDGGYFQGDYNELTLKPFMEALYVFDTGTTDVAVFDSTSCLEGWGDYIVWDTPCRSGLPLEAYGFGGGKQSYSCRHAGGRAVSRQLINMLASTYQDANSMWLEDQYASHASAINSNEHWGYIVEHDTLLAGVSPVTAGWPIAKQWDVGTVHMRSGWDLSTASEDVWCVYRHEQYPFGHAHADVGHFTIMRGQDILLPDTGLRTGSGTHVDEYYTQTIAHNCLTIKDFAETFAAATENTGGQDRRALHPVTVGAYTDSMASAVQGRGSITDFSVVGDTLVYVRSDMTDAYWSSKVDTVRREFVWLKPKNTFLVFDTVKLDSTGYLQKQLFHMIPNPTTLSGAARWTEGDGTVKLTALFGTGDVTITEVGGTGHHFDCNGTNYGTEEVEYDEGDYRLELSPGRSADHRWMLTAIQVTASADTSYSTLALVTTGDYIGAVVDGDTVLFHKYGGAYATGQSAAAATLDLPITTLSYTYADSSLQKFGVGNSGDGILSWESTFLSDWIADAANDTGTVGVGYDSVTVQLKWAEIDSAAVWSDTIAVSGGGDGQVIINVKGEIVYIPPTINPALYQKDFFQDLYAASDTVCCHSSHWDVIVPDLVYAGDWEIYPFGAKSKVADGLNVKVTLAKSDNGWSDTFFVPIDHEHWKNEITLRQLFSTAVDSIAVQAAFSTCAAGSLLQYQFIMEGW
jgi:hypothetical protein